MEGVVAATIEAKMECLKEVLTKLLQEMLPNGEKVLDETHDEKKRNFSHDFGVPNFGLKTHHIPRVDMRKFDSKEITSIIGT